MDIIRFGKLLSEILPKIKTTIQLTGLLVGLAFALIIHFVKPGNNTAMIVGGATGILFVIFGQLFHFLSTFRQKDRPAVFLASFAMFCVFELALVVMFVVLVHGPSMSITPHTPTKEEEDASHSRSDIETYGEWLAGSISTAAFAATSPATRVGNTVTLTRSKDQIHDPRDVEYKFTEVDGVPTLRAELRFSRDSRKGLFPDGDFHEGVSFGNPWVSLDIANPSKEALVFTTLAIDVKSLELINEFIPNAGEVDGVTRDSAKLEIVNEGWGRANNPTLKVEFAKWLGGENYQILAEASYALASFDDVATINVAKEMPDFALWRSYKGFDKKKRDASIELLCTLSYTDERGKPVVETFTTVMYTTFGGGGNLFPAVYYNVTLPTSRAEYPVLIPVANCIAGNSAEEIVLRFNAERSARFRLAVTLKTTTGTAVESDVDVDVIRPRKEYTSPYKDGKFLADKEHKGCT